MSAQQSQQTAALQWSHVVYEMRGTSPSKAAAPSRESRVIAHSAPSAGLACEPRAHVRAQGRGMGVDKLCVENPVCAE
jgi:hypothetical protein